MNQELQVIENKDLLGKEVEIVNSNIDKLIAENISSEEFVSQLAFLCTGILSCGDDFEVKVSDKLRHSMIWGGLYGTNRSLGDKLVLNKNVAQYVAQIVLQKLADKKLMSFDLITAINNRFNASIHKIDVEFDNIYKGMDTFLKKNRNELAKLESRLNVIEQNLRLVKWAQSIEYQDFNGVEYAEMEPEEKIVCLVRDFYDITEGKWNTSDLLTLKSAMADIDLYHKDKLNFFAAIQAIANNPEYRAKLLGGKEVKKMRDPSLLLSLSGLSKLHDYANEEHYLVESFGEMLADNGISMPEEKITQQLALKYFRKDVLINMDVEIDVYGLCLDLLYNLKIADKLGLLVPAEELLQDDEGISSKALAIVKAELTNAKSDLAYYQQENDNLKQRFKLIEELKKKVNVAFQNVGIGDVIKFGKYPQNNDGQKQDIEWQVLDVEEKRIFLMSKYALDAVQFHPNDNTNDWDKCNLRTWLNNTFLKSAFSSGEIAKILSTKFNNNTEDKLFLLSEGEVLQYLPNQNQRKCKPTAYAKANGGYSSSSMTRWWLRTKSKYTGYGFYINYDGLLGDGAYRVTYSEACVRPAMWISIED